MSESLQSASAEELRSGLRSANQALRRLHYRRLELWGELDRRGLVIELGLRRLADLIAIDTGCSYREAKQLELAVQRFTDRASLAGECLPPEYPLAAAGLAETAFGLAHASVVADTVEAIPFARRAECAVSVEQKMVELAREHDPVTLARLGKRIVAHLDPDGPEPVEQAAQAQRAVRIVPRAGGDFQLAGRLTPECAAIWQPVLAALAAPPAGRDDTRTADQRSHDAFADAGRHLLASGRLGQHAGLPAQIIVTVDLRDLEQRIGCATTHHGGTLSIRAALRLAADARVIPAILDQELGLLELGLGRRLASPAQRLAAFARDRGCTFPGCGKPAARSELHHVRDWTRGGPTDIDNLAIACGFHNNEAPKQGWQTVFIDGVPHWRPPDWLDPQRTPRRNWLHHAEQLVSPDNSPNAPPEPRGTC